MAENYSGRVSVKPTLLTVNRLADPRPQPSLSECLRLGAAYAHRGIRKGPEEGRNFRRSTPLGRKYVVE